MIYDFIFYLASAYGLYTFMANAVKFVSNKFKKKKKEPEVKYGDVGQVSQFVEKSGYISRSYGLSVEEVEKYRKERGLSNA